MVSVLTGDHRLRNRDYIANAQLRLREKIGFFAHPRRVSRYHRYIGDDSVYRRSFKDKFVTIRAMGDHFIRNRDYIANAQLRLREKIGDFSRILDA